MLKKSFPYMKEMRTQPRIIDRGKNLYPDYVVFLNVYIIIVECKLQHSLDAYEQLRLKYWRATRLPQVRILEVCKYFNPYIELPERPVVLESLREEHFDEDNFYIYPWRG